MPSLPSMDVDSGSPEDDAICLRSPYEQPCCFQPDRIRRLAIIGPHQVWSHVAQDTNRTESLCHYLLSRLILLLYKAPSATLEAMQIFVSIWHRPTLATEPGREVSLCLPYPRRGILCPIAKRKLSIVHDRHKMVRAGLPNMAFRDGRFLISAILALRSI
ncbi:hypothetical protein KC347_g106 [Hortaea werneckii]|nr:hypothetical protein KC347_g106 [Hortaea werneckii]